MEIRVLTIHTNGTQTLESQTLTPEEEAALEQTEQGAV